MRPHLFLLTSSIMLTVILMPLALDAQDSAGYVITPDRIIHGPCSVEIEGISSLQLPDSILFVHKEDAIKLIEGWGNIPSGDEIGLFTHVNRDWVVRLNFERIGYVRDDEKADLDSNKLMESLQEGAEEANKERHKRGFPAMTPVSWAIPPYYNDEHQTLEWAAKYELEGKGQVVNFETRVLGRYGITNVTLACSPESLTAVLPQFRQVMAGYSYLSGQTYAEFREGDKIAEYGLSALVVGGAAAVAAKTGLFKWLWKLIVVVFAGGAALLKKWFGKKETPYSKLPGT